MGFIDYRHGRIRAVFTLCPPGKVLNHTARFRAFDDFRRFPRTREPTIERLFLYVVFYQVERPFRLPLVFGEYLTPRGRLFIDSDKISDERNDKRILPPLPRHK